MYLGSAVLGGHLVLGLSVRGTHGPRASCPGRHFRGGTCHTMTQGMVWGEPELLHVWKFDHMVFFTVIMLMRCE